MADADILKAAEDGDLERVKELLAVADSSELSSLRDAVGQTLAHVLAETLGGHADIFTQLLGKQISLAARNKEGVSPLDVLLNGKGGLEVVKSIVHSLLLENKVDTLKEIIMSGFMIPADQLDLDQLAEEGKQHLNNLLELQARISNLHAAVRNGQVEEVKAMSDLADMVQAADMAGLPALQVAVVCQQPEIAQHIVSTFPGAVNCTDFMNRSALHYAAVSPDDGSLYKVLTDAGGDQTLVDINGMSPSDYLNSPDRLSLMEARDKLEAVVQSRLNPKKDSRPASSADRAAEGVVPQAEVDELGQEAAEEPQQQAQGDTPPPQRTPPPQTPPKPATPPGPKVHKPVQMYVPQAREEQAPPPSTVDGKYIAQHLGTALTLALAEIAEKRPWDPIEFLANWLYKYHENTEYVQKREEMLQTIRNEEARLNEEEELKFKRQEELKRIQEDEVEKRRQEEEERKKREQEELQRSAKEAALAQKPQLPTVTEEGEESINQEEDEDDDTNLKDRNPQGCTEMHLLASQQGIDLAALIQLGYSIADRDLAGRTVRDVALQANQRETVQAIDDYVKRLLEDGRTDILEQLVLDGFQDFESQANENLPEVTKNFLERLIGLREQIATSFKAAETGDETEVKEALDALPALAKAKNNDGCTLLHVAVLAQSRPIVEFLSDKFPESVRARDNANRTPLHYAYGVCSDQLVQILTEHGASEKAKDNMKQSPVTYKTNNAEIIALQRKLGLAAPADTIPPVVVTDENQTTVDAVQEEDVSTGQQEVEPPLQLATTVTTDEGEATQQQE